MTRCAGDCGPILQARAIATKVVATVNIFERVLKMETIRCVCEWPQQWAHEKYGDKWDSYISQFAEKERNAVAGYIYERSFYESDCLFLPTISVPCSKASGLVLRDSHMSN